jgi:hypothetical protein
MELKSLATISSGRDSEANLDKCDSQSSLRDVLLSRRARMTIPEWGFM